MTLDPTTAPRCMPLRFIGEEVRAIQAGRKTQTRRPLPKKSQISGDGRSGGLWAAMKFWSPIRVGDVIWVRETWAELCEENTDGFCPCKDDKDRDQNHEYVYRADNPRDKYPGGWDEGLLEELGFTKEDVARWRPSIHMPRKAARIFLKVTGVRGERLQALTKAWLVAEGMPDMRGQAERIGTPDVLYALEYGWFKAVWNRQYAKRGLSFESNPWVFVYEFVRTEAPDA